jgi:membrane protease YdiL (CAAX protease family)
MAPEPDVLLGAAMLTLGIASVGIWFYLIDRLSRGPILTFEPREPVPWGGVWTLLPVLLVLLTLVAAISGTSGAAPDEKQATATDLMERIALGSAEQMALVFAMMAVMIAVSRAKYVDLGLPKSGAELLEDLRIGFFAWLAALVPVYGVQFLLISIFGQAEGHPLIKMVEEQANPSLFVLAFVAAVVVAPLCEELLFRLVLQGWLEKWEDTELGWRIPPVPVPTEIELGDTVATVTEKAVTIEAQPVEVAAALLTPPESGVGGLPYGWFPIGVSSLLFALAHVGYGPDPIPLFLLALIMGYVYQRTHRLVPSMVTHALFNGMSLFALWRVMSAGGP